MPTGKTHSTPKQPRNSKRIHSVTIKRMYDESPDTNWLGEYANSPASEFSIDRAHDEDCPQQTFNKPTEAIDLLERIMVHIRNVKDAHCGTIKNRTDADKARDLDVWSDYDDAEDICIDASTEVEDECTCGRGEWPRNEYRYFNPSRNYDGDTPENIRKYTRQDHERMESLNASHWGFIGIRAECEYSIGDNRAGRCLIQELSSGGLWGIESDSEEDYLTSVEEEELSELRSQLKAIGFSSRAISAAFKNVDRKDL